MLEGRTAVVTGSSFGMGRSIATALASLGATVIGNSRSPVADPGISKHIVGDVRDTTVIEELVSHKPDIVVVNAGVGLKGSATTSDESKWREMMELNIIAAAKLIRRAAESMLEDSSKPRDIVVIGSVVGNHVSPYSSIYGATKAALHMITEAARRELGPKGIRVTLIVPGFTQTNFASSAGYDAAMVDGMRAKFGPPLSPDHIAHAVCMVVTAPIGVHYSNIEVRPTGQDYP